MYKDILSWVSLVIMLIIFIISLFPKRPKIIQFSDGKFAVKKGIDYLDKTSDMYWTESFVDRHCKVNTLEEAKLIVKRYRDFKKSKKLKVIK